MNLIYSCIFCNKDYIQLLSLLLNSYIKYNTYRTKYLIIPHKSFETEIKQLLSKYNINHDIWCLNKKSILGACCSRLLIFNNPKINKYKKILYLDTDIIITNYIKILFNYELDKELYVFNEDRKINDWGHGEILFTKENIKIDKTTEVFSTCVLLFLNCDEIKSLFYNINLLIDKYFPKKSKYNLKSCYDQDFIIYQCVIEQKYNNQLITKHIYNYCNHLENNMLFNHFCMPCGDTEGKYDKMTNFMVHIDSIRIPKIEIINRHISRNKNTLNI